MTLHSSIAVLPSIMVHPSIRPENGDSPLGGSNKTIHPRTPKWDIPHSEVATRLHPSIHMLRRWDILHSVAATNFFSAGILPPRRNVCTCRWWDLPY